MSCTFHRGRLSKHLFAYWCQMESFSPRQHWRFCYVCFHSHNQHICKIFTNTALMIGMERRKHTKLCEWKWVKVCDQVREVEVEHTTCEKAKKKLYKFFIRETLRLFLRLLVVNSSKRQAKRLQRRTAIASKCDWKITYEWTAKKSHDFHLMGWNEIVALGQEK